VKPIYLMHEDGLTPLQIGAVVECIITEVMHEVAHMFWTPYDKRGHSIIEALGPHGTNRCIMRQGWSVPDDWLRMTEDRIRYGAFCPACKADLRRFFDRAPR